MGADFIERATPSFKKRWDRALVDLRTDDLFTRQPECAARSAAAELTGNASLEVGEKVMIEKTKNGLVARRGLEEVARFTNPSSALVRAVENSCGVATGTVDEVHELAAIAEISIC